MVSSLNPYASSFTPAFSGRGSAGIAEADGVDSIMGSSMVPQLASQLTLQAAALRLEERFNSTAKQHGAPIVLTKNGTTGMGLNEPQHGEEELCEELLFEHDDVNTPRGQSQDTTSAEVTPLRPNELPGGLGAVMLDSPCVAVPLAGELRGDSSSGGSSFDGEISEVSPGKLGPGDYELLRVVGQGAFGKVFQVRKRDSGHVYAMKVMRKERILARDHGDYVKAERDVLTAVFHPYIVTLRCSFQTASKLYLVLDFVNGGHLFFQLYRQGIFDEDLARLYTAELVLAIAHLHSLGIAHRDLKPENVLLDSEGHVKVTDFGLAKPGLSDDTRTNSFIGTMEYMAPEVVAGKGHGKAVDWWSVGILLYEMLCGVPPFRAKGRDKLQRQICAAKLKLPPYMSSEAASLLRGLLQREPPKRLGYGPKGSEDIMAHAFFRPLNWGRLLRREMASPFRPSVNHADSVENFDKIWTDLAPEDSPCGTPPGAHEFSAFQGFTYCAPSFLESVAAKVTRTV